MQTASSSRRLRMLALPTVAVAAALAFSGPAGAATAAPSPTLSPTVGSGPVVTTTQGIIMRDGGICDPIRHMGC